MAKGPRPRPLADRFWAKVEKSAGCWEWTGFRSRTGYGMTNVWRDGKWRKGWAHRVAWELTTGWIPAGYEVAHTCDNRGCVRPDHLWLATHAENMADMLRKGRQHYVPNYGEKNGRARLTVAAVREIRARYRPGVYGLVVGLAREFGVGKSAIWDVIRQRRWVDATA